MAVGYPLDARVIAGSWQPRSGTLDDDEKRDVRTDFSRWRYSLMNWGHDPLK